MSVEIDLEQKFPGGGTIKFAENNFFNLKSSDKWYVRYWGLSGDVEDLIDAKIKESKMKNKHNRVIAWRNIKKEVIYQYQEKICRECPLFKNGCVGVEESTYYPPLKRPEVRINRNKDQGETEEEFKARVAMGLCQKKEN